MNAPAWNVVGIALKTAPHHHMLTGHHHGPYIRLCGAIDHHTGHTRLFTDPTDLLHLLDHAKVIYGHNLFGSALLALAHHHRIDYMHYSAKAMDTLLIARQTDPVPTRTQQNNPDYHQQHHLHTLARKLGHPPPRHTTATLAATHGGADKIPPDHPHYRDSLTWDLTATRLLAQYYRPKADTYVRREHKIAPLQHLPTLNGWRIDTDLLTWREQTESKEAREAARWLNHHYQLPLGRTTHRPGASPTTRWTPYQSPLRTAEGAAALEKAFKTLGVEPPRTPQGALTTTADALSDGWWMKGRHRQPGLLRQHPHHPQLRDLCHHITLASGKAHKYQEIRKNLIEDRVHPLLSDIQASGRWATTRPSLANIGKRGHRNLAERAVFLPEPDELHLTFDLDQIDLRAVAALSEDHTYQQLFRPGIDAHTENAKLFFNDPNRRADAKPLGLGALYGMTSDLIAETHGLHPPEVRHAIDTLWRTYPRLAAWRAEAEHQGRHGLLDNGFGRKMRPDPTRSYTQSPALIGQGASRDLLCEGLLQLPSWTWPMLRGFNHDEIILSVPRDKLQETTEVVTEALTQNFKGVPITCTDSPPGATWRDCYPT